MLVEFSVANYRSFSSEQTLSLSAGRFRSPRIGAILDTPSKTAPHLLRTVAIMGANAAGKSSLIKALEFMQSFVAESAQSTQRGDRIAVSPFRLDEALSSKPSTFTIVFLYESIEYRYTFSVTSKRVTNECLLSRSKSAAFREIFSRSFTEDGEVWNLGSLPKAQARLWQKSTRENALFLSIAVQLNSEELAKPFKWIAYFLRIQTTDDDFFPSLTSHMIRDHVNDGYRDSILNLLRDADLGIRDVKVEEESFDESSIPGDMPDDMKHSLINAMKDETYYQTTFEHRTKQMKSVSFDFEDESDGTQRLYAMAGALVSTVRHGFTLVIDEIEASLHPFIVRMIIQMFQSPEDMGSRAQLVFTTHSDSLLDSGLLERDQFWLVEKRRGSTELIALNDYAPRKGEAMRLNYLRGKYGGVPAIAKVDRN